MHERITEGDSGYPEQAPEEVSPGKVDGTDASRSRENGRPDSDAVERAPDNDDGKATGNRRS